MLDEILSLHFSYKSLEDHENGIIDRINFCIILIVDRTSKLLIFKFLHFRDRKKVNTAECS